MQPILVTCYSFFKKLFACLQDDVAGCKIDKLTSVQQRGNQGNQGFMKMRRPDQMNFS